MSASAARPQRYVRRQEPTEQELTQAGLTVQGIAEELQEKLSLNNIAELEENKILQLLRKDNTLPERIRSGLVLNAIFNKSAQIVRTETEAEKRLFEELRYRVFVKDREFEEDNGSGIEQDGYDVLGNGIIYIPHGTTEALTGLRGITPQGEDPKKYFPMQQAFTDLEALLQSYNIRLEECIEISRLAKDRIKPFEQKIILNASTEFNKVASGEMTAATFAFFIRLSAERAIEEGKTHCLFAVERALTKSLKRVGDDPIILGPAVEYHGKRIPVLMDLRRTFELMAHNNPAMWAVATDNGRLVRELEALEQHIRLRRCSLPLSSSAFLYTASHGEDPPTRIP